MSARCSDAQITALRQSLSGIETSDAADTLEAYGHDESGLAGIAPQLVVFPKSTEEVQKVLRLALQHRVPVTPVGARSGKSGGSIPVEGGISLSLERMNKILEIRPEDLTAEVEPGVILEHFMAAVEERGLFYPPDPNSHAMCTLGGNVAENAGGPRALKYGVTKDYVLGMTWVLPDGRVLEVGRRTIKGVAGYDMVGLFVGSEGTLGVATKIRLRLIPKPAKVMTALILFQNVNQAALAVTEALRSGFLPRTLELIDDVAIEALSKQGFHFNEGVNAAVIAEVDGHSEDAVLNELSQLAEVFTRNGALDTAVAQDESQREQLWARRRSLSVSLRKLRSRKVSEDVVVPRSAIPVAIQKYKRAGQQHGLQVATYGHAGDGNLHVNVLFDAGEEAKVDLVLKEMMQLTVEMGGTITGEHGVGVAKRDFLSLEQSWELIEVQKGIKKLFDPEGLFNPGKIFP